MTPLQYGNALDLSLGRTIRMREAAGRAAQSEALPMDARLEAAEEYRVFTDIAVLQLKNIAADIGFTH